MAKIKICKEPSCNNAGTTAGYCRLHYLKNWKKIKGEKGRKSAERLNKYIENLVGKHPGRYVEVLKKEIRSKQFEKAASDPATSDLDDVFKIFNEPGCDSDIEQLIRNLKIENKF